MKTNKPCTPLRLDLRTAHQRGLCTPGMLGTEHAEPRRAPPQVLDGGKDAQCQERQHSCPRVSAEVSCKCGITFILRGLQGRANISRWSSLGDGGIATEGGPFPKPWLLEQQRCPQGRSDRGHWRTWWDGCRRHARWIWGTSKMSCKFYSNNNRVWISEIHLFLS